MRKRNPSDDNVLPGRFMLEMKTKNGDETYTARFVTGEFKTFRNSYCSLISKHSIVHQYDHTLYYLDVQFQNLDWRRLIVAYV